MLSSPRRRRRLAWLTGALVVGSLVAFALALLPRQGGSGAKTFTSPPTNPFGAPAPRPAEERAGAAAAKAVRPRAEAFIAALVYRDTLPWAHALLAPNLRRRYSLADWRAGDRLPVSFDPHKQYVISTVTSFYGTKDVGFVSAVSREDQASTETPLVAFRFRKVGRRWLVDYISQGHSSRLVDQTNYAPAGFLPGSHRQSAKDWAILLGGFLAVVALVLLLDRFLGGGRRPAEV